jgi:hypothetical protein
MPRAHPPTNLLLARKVLTWLATIGSQRASTSRSSIRRCSLPCLPSVLRPASASLARGTGSGTASRSSGWSVHRCGGVAPSPPARQCQEERTGTPRYAGGGQHPDAEVSCWRCPVSLPRLGPAPQKESEEADAEATHCNRQPAAQPQRLQLAKEDSGECTVTAGR